MSRPGFICCVLAAWVGLGSAALAAEHRYDHNGSEMIVRTTNDLVEIRYAVPRDGLGSAGVRQGTLLFEGVNNAGYVDGMANVFSSKCGQIDYYVHGDFALGEDFKLTGAAPVRDATTCAITDNVYDGPASELVFTALGAEAPAQGGACVPSGETAAVRSGPAQSYGVLHSISGCGIEVREDACRGAWCPVEQNGIFGWMDTRVLR